MRSALHHFRDSALETYAWKKPQEKTKNDQFSLVLWLVAIFMFLVRFTWISQFLKLIYRSCASSDSEISPLIAEIYLLTSITASISIGVWTSYGFAPTLHHRHVIAILCIWKIFESLTSNLYYLILRPMLDVKAPHSTYRSFVLAALALVEVWLLLCLIWLFIGTTKPALTSFLTSVYFTSSTFFTVGYGDYSPAGDLAHALAVFTMCSGALMLGVVLSRALSLVRPLPNSTGRIVEPPADACHEPAK